MRVYLLKESDFEKLQLLIEKLAAEKLEGISKEDQIAVAQTKRAYRYEIFTWISEMKEPKS